jgi:hypothetical protein
LKILSLGSEFSQTDRSKEANGLFSNFENASKNYRARRRVRNLRRKKGIANLKARKREKQIKEEKWMPRQV